MNLKLMRNPWFMIMVALWMVSFPSIATALIADHTAAANFNNISADSFSSVRSTFNIYYGHTSHGSQIITGVSMLENENSALYGRPTIYEDDWIDLGDTDWDPLTRDYLNNHPETNLVMWSWCGQLTWYPEGEVNDYLTTMSQLEADYPNVTFVYMTGHLDGLGPSGDLYTNNNRIRSFCSANSKVLFDFADIESYDPDGNYYPDGSDCCEWCSSWCANHSCPSCDDCAHSQCINCYLKGKAFWWMLVQTLGIAVPSSPSIPAPSNGGGNCFIATAAYGSQAEPHVKILRQFRDVYLLSSNLGHAFVDVYYRYSPPVADFIARHENLRAVVRLGLLPLVYVSYATLYCGISTTTVTIVIASIIAIGLILFCFRKEVTVHGVFRSH